MNKYTFVEEWKNQQMLNRIEEKYNGKKDERLTVDKIKKGMSRMLKGE